MSLTVDDVRGIAVATRHISRYPVELRVDGTAEGRITAYASTFEQVDSYGERMRPGSFLRSLEENGLPFMSWEHEWQLGPMGDVLDATEDERGFRYNTQLYMDSDLPNRIYRSVKAKNIKQNSFAFIPRKTQAMDEETRVSDDHKRDVLDIDLLEVALVVRGANTDTPIVAVRSAEDDEAFSRRIDEMLNRRAAAEKAEAERTAAEAERVAYLNSLQDVEPWERDALTTGDSGQ